MIKSIKYLLFPFAIIYWLVTYIRNALFNLGIKKQTSFKTPIISIGNITVGGTGKTPHTQYLVEKLQSQFSIATLSRGYKRNTTGFIIADKNTSPLAIGDEPYQLHTRFPTITVAVCENRVEGALKLIENKKPDLIILDDAFQHRYIKPGLQIVLIDYNRPIWKDFVFPVGFLREGKYALKRADIIIVSKCPILSKEKQNAFTEKLQIKAHQKVFFSRMQYGNLYQLDSLQTQNCNQLLEQNQVLLITGLANAENIHSYLHTFTPFITHLDFADHYTYSQEDVKHMQSMHAKLSETMSTCIITTEKDVYKLKEAGLYNTNIPVFVLPIEVVFDLNTTDFDSEIFNYLASTKNK